MVPRFFSSSYLSHANAVIADGQGAVLFIGCNMNVQVFFFTFMEVSVRLLKYSLSQASDALEISSRRKISRLVLNRIDHQVKQLFALGLKLMHCHSYNDLTFIYFMV